MARRESEYLFARRFAAGGNDNGAYYSRAREDRFSRDRRFAARGNGIGNRDSWDLKIKRLRQRVRDLEIQQEIKRLRRRVRDLELQRERNIKETESEHIVWDDVNEGEEYPFCHPHPRFFDPTCEDKSDQEILSDDKPKFDEDGIKPDEEECLFVHQVLSGVNVQVKDKDDVFYSFPNDDAAAQGGGMVTFGNGNTVVSGSGLVDSVGQNGSRKVLSSLETQTNLLIFGNGWNNSLKGSDILHTLKFQIKDINIKDFFSKSNGILGDNDEIGGGTTIHISHEHGNVSKSNMEGIDGPLECELNDAIGSMETKDMGQQIQSGSFPLVCENSTFLSGHISKIQTDLIELVRSMVHTKLSTSFDPGGTSLELGETIRKVELFRRVMIIITMNRVDVPFDPGGFDPKTKLEDEFFQRRGV